MLLTVDRVTPALGAVERDVSTVHKQLTRLESLGVIYFAEEGQSKRPVVWFDDLVIDIPFDEESNTLSVEAAG